MSVRARLPFFRFSHVARGYAVQAPGRPALEVFNQHVKRIQKDRAAARVEESRKVDYLREEVAARLTDRMLDINRSFPQVLDMGAHSCQVARALTAPQPPLESGRPSDPPIAARRKIEELICIDESAGALERDVALPFHNHTGQVEMNITRQHVPTLESLPFPPNSFDAILSSLSLHWINDLPSALTSARAALRPDAPFIAAMTGGDSLFELRGALQLADLERRGGVAPHVSPLADVRDVGGLLTGAGFRLLTVDMEDIVVGYPDVFALMADLQAMGEGNAILKRDQAPLSRDVLLATDAIYRALHAEEGHEGIPATFRIIYMIGWKPSDDQAQPLPRGSGQVDLSKVLGGGKIG